jgi:hypothetical protein
MTVIHHDDPNGIPITPTMPAAGQFSLGVSPVVLGLNSKPIFETCICIDIQRPGGNDASPYPIKALLTNFLKEIQKVDPTNVILPIDPASKHGALVLTSDAPADENGVTKYFGGFQDAYERSPTANKTLCVFVRIRSAQSLHDLKFNTGFFQWLKDNKLFVHTHGFSTMYDVGSTGFISRMSPTLHRRDTITDILKRKIAQRAPDVEIHLMPNQIAIGNRAQKQHTMVVELQVDQKFLHTAREMLIKIFKTKIHALPRNIYFVPSPANSIMGHNTYNQHLRLHHAHVANLRSFAITNVSGIKAEITIYDPYGRNPHVMSFKQALLSKSYGDTNEPLFYSIEPTQASTTEGRYLLVTNKNAIKGAETFIDMALASPKSNSNNCAQAQLFKAHIPHTNHINASEKFQEYANKLKNMIPKTNLPKHPGHNAWKYRPPTKVNLTDKDFPPLTPKKTKILYSTEQDNTTATGQTNLLTDVDV